MHARRESARFVTRIDAGWEGECMSASPLRRSLKIYSAYQAGGLGLWVLSVVSMLMADQTVLTREPRLPLLYLVVLGGLFGGLGAFKAWRAYQAR
jgi:hypothetical protein